MGVSESSASDDLTRFNVRYRDARHRGSLPAQFKQSPYATKQPPLKSRNTYSWG